MRYVGVMVLLLAFASPLVAAESPEGDATLALKTFYGRVRDSAGIPSGFAVALVLMTIAVASGNGWVRRAGLAAFILATIVVLASLAVRWSISGRAWYLPPVMNQFEAVAGSVVLGGALAIVLGLVYKLDYFVLAAALYATVAMLACKMFPQAMGADLSPAHGILDSPVMAAHVSVIIVGHAMAGMTLVISLVYLAGAAWAVLNGRALGSSGADLATPAGAGMLAAVDRCNLIVAQLAAWGIACGIILGAYWGQTAWGRWWGWDPKETWALITAAIYLAVLHLRFAVGPKRRGLVTAVGCILGCAAMLFNWIVVNYLIAGKHSYA